MRKNAHLACGFLQWASLTPEIPKQLLQCLLVYYCFNKVKNMINIYSFSLCVGCMMVWSLSPHSVPKYLFRPWRLKQVTVSKCSFENQACCNFLLANCPYLPNWLVSNLLLICQIFFLLSFLHNPPYCRCKERGLFGVSCSIKRGRHGTQLIPWAETWNTKERKKKKQDLNGTWPQDIIEPDNISFNLNNDARRLQVWFEDETTVYIPWFFFTYLCPQSLLPLANLVT